MASKRGVRRKACDGKVRHKSREGALIAAGKYGGMKNGLCTYRCKFCNGYHVGHMPGWMRRSRRGNV